MPDHLDREALRRLVYRRCHASRAYGWLLHLLSCAHCRQRVVDDHPGEGDRFLRTIFQTQEPLEPPDLEDPERLERILQDLQTCGLSEYLEEGDLPPLLQDLHRHPRERQRLILDNTERLWTLSTAIHLLERSEAELRHLPEHGLHLADLALSVFQRLSSDRYHPQLLADYQGRALTTRGNYYRILQRLSKARRDLEWAGVVLRKGSRNFKECARLLRVRGALERNCHRFEEGIRLQTQGAVLCRYLGDRAQGLKFKWTIANSLYDAGEVEKATEYFQALLEEVDPDRDGPDLALGLRNNLALALAELGLGTAAYKWHQEAVRFFPPQQVRWKLKLQITRTVVLEALGDYRWAERTSCELIEDLGQYFTARDHAVHWNDRARWAVRCKDRFLAQRYAREACHFLAKTESWDEISAVQRMLAGGPLVYL